MFLFYFLAFIGFASPTVIYILLKKETTTPKKKSLVILFSIKAVIDILFFVLLITSALYFVVLLILFINLCSYFVYDRTKNPKKYDYPKISIKEIFKIPPQKSTEKTTTDYEIEDDINFESNDSINFFYTVDKYVDDSDECYPDNDSCERYINLVKNKYLHRAKEFNFYYKNVSADRATPRKVFVESVYFKRGVYYMDAHDSETYELKTYRFDRIEVSSFF